MIDIEHSHCPCDCDHPQPVQLADDERVPQALRGQMVCGRCLFKFNEACVMVPCTPDTCPE